MRNDFTTSKQPRNGLVYLAAGAFVASAIQPPEGKNDALGEAFPRKERETFGEDGFENIVERVSNIERQLDIHDVNRRAPQPSLAG
jgi:hypothetical protein